MSMGSAITFQAGIGYTMAFATDPRLIMLWGFLIYVIVWSLQMRGGLVLWVSVAIEADVVRSP